MTETSLEPERLPANTEGLSSAEAAERLRRDGYNELPAARSRHVLSIALDVVREPMLLLLVVAATLYLFLGDLEGAVVLLASVLLIMGITFYQERRTERTLEALRDLASPRALVIRDGERIRIAGREVVRGDVLVLAEGDRVPADALVLACTNLSADESLLTGESVPVRKIAAAPSVRAMERPGGDNQPFVFSGTLVVQGNGLAHVLETGPQTEVGKIGHALRQIEVERTPLQREIGRIVRVMAIVAIAICVVLVLAYGLINGDWLAALLGGITLAMSAIPEEIPVVLTVFLAIGAWRMAQRQVLARRVPAIQALGSVTVLCVDKTGTLTFNRMAVEQLMIDHQRYDARAAVGTDVPPPFQTLIQTSVLASESAPFDPMERALHALADRALGQPAVSAEGLVFAREYPLAPDLLAVTRAWRTADGHGYLVTTKGAPEAIAELCHLDAAGRADVSVRVSTMAEQGLRVLGVARATSTPAALPDDPRAFPFEFLGLVGLADPVRPTVPEAIQACYSAGVRVVMITGDYPGTAQAIARQIGLTPSDVSITGPELDRMSDEELREAVSGVSIFARVVPQQKLRLVSAFKANGQIVAMTGDGVNDAPALRAAHVGVAMGARGTDVAREAAGIVLLDDDFTSIVAAIRLGRRIFDNLRKAMAYIFAVHVPIAGLALIPVLVGWPLVLFPVHIVFLELIIDPACSIVFESEQEEADVMRRPPRDPGEPVLGRATTALSLAQGASTLAVIIAVYGLGLRLLETPAEARALAFTTLVLANLGLILVNRSWSRTVLATLKTPNAALWWVLAGAALVLALVLAVPFLRELFAFGVLHPTDIAICLGASLLSLLWFEGWKVAGQWRSRRRQTRG